MKPVQAAIVREKSASFTIESLILDPPRAHEVLVRIVATGVCHTDTVARDQDYPVPLPAVLGHEGAGIVEQVGENVSTLSVGDHVVLSFGSCGHCSNCISGKPSYCSHFYDHNFKGARLDNSTPLHTHDHHDVGGYFFSQSSFATYAIVTDGNAIRIPKDVPLEIMGPLGCGIQTGAGAIINTLKPSMGSSLAVFGTGAVGMAAIMAAHALGVTTIIAVDLYEERLKLGLELGATHTVNARSQDVVNVIKELTGGGVDFSLECTGKPQVLRQSVDVLSIPGVCGIIGAAPMGAEVSLDINTLLFGRSVRGIIEGDSLPKVFIPQLIELWRTGRFPFHKLIEFFELENINEAVKASESGKVLKPVIRMPNCE